MDFSIPTKLININVKTKVTPLWIIDQYKINELFFCFYLWLCKKSVFKKQMSIFTQLKQQLNVNKIILEQNI